MSDTVELEHDAAPVVEQPELILLNKLTGSAGLKAAGNGFAKAEAAKAQRTREASMTSKNNSSTAVKEKGLIHTTLLKTRI